MDSYFQGKHGQLFCYTEHTFVNATSLAGHLHPKQMVLSQLMGEISFEEGKREKNRQEKQNSSYLC